MTRRVFRRFRYTECDDFAAYLMKMAREGWHFNGWKLGLIFEKGEPEEVEFSVEVFIKGTEWDVRPDAYTEEFAEYCKEAGWEFIDSNKKFIVFKKFSDDAVDIVSPEEHLKNASWAEIKGSILQCIGWILIAGINMFESITETFYHDIFSLSILVIVGIFVILTLKSMITSIIEVINYKKRCKMIDCGEKIYLGIGEDKQKKRYWRDNLFSPLLVCLIIIVVFFEIGSKPVIPIVIGLIMLVLCLWFIEYIRPVRSEYVLATFIVSILVPVLTIVYLFLQPEDEIVYTEKNMAPLLIEDYREPECMFEDIRIDNTSNLFGSFTEYRVTYHETSGNSDIEIWDEIQYMMIESKYEWILDYSWKIYTKNIPEYEECTDDWKADYAMRVQNWWWISYCVRYDDQIFVLKFEKPNLSQEQINIIREKIGLGQVM